MELRQFFRAGSFAWVIGTIILVYSTTGRVQASLGAESRNSETAIDVDLSDTKQEYERDDDGEVENEIKQKRAVIHLRNKKDVQKLIKLLDGTSLAPALSQLGDLNETRPAPYEQVPSRQVHALALRLELTKKILKRSGRAYDYRLYTVAQLKHILSRLN